ncbi:hypothetical protein AB0H43_12430 [Hamadaea sp. NPDC050747]|uniref:hypothetical protein n=1 Tax=Hamadaea sp. NPDC050747 TaxID=3155789 RepID=UPI0033D32151
MRNERFGEAIRSAGYSFGDLAYLAGVNMKTAQRWFYEGRTPRRRAANAAAAVLNVDPSWLWPQRVGTGDPKEVVEVYPGLRSIPMPLWRRLTTDAERRIWISTEHLDVVTILGGMRSLLRDRAQAGVDVRLLLFKGHGLQSISRRKTIKTFNGPLRGPSLMIFDDVMLVPHDFSAVAVAPVIRLHRRRDDGMFEAFVHAFNDSWIGTGNPVR